MEQKGGQGHFEVRDVAGAETLGRTSHQQTRDGWATGGELNEASEGSASSRPELSPAGSRVQARPDVGEAGRAPRFSAFFFLDRNASAIPPVGHITPSDRLPPETSSLPCDLLLH